MYIFKNNIKTTSNVWSNSKKTHTLDPHTSGVYRDANVNS